ncbi:MAG: hypothetical protein K6F80_06580 [Oscillospiraceae bacterium]|nr:hypothetical protein [Oscillospiraceae bacterium]
MRERTLHEAIIAAAVTGLLSLIGTIITVLISSQNTSDKLNAQLQISQAVTDTKIEELTREVREHNNFARRMPVVEEQIKVVNHRLDDLENDGK